MSIKLASNGSTLRRCRKAFSSSPGAVRGLIICGYSRGACDWFFSFPPLLPFAPVCFVVAVEVVMAVEVVVIAVEVVVIAVEVVIVVSVGMVVG